ncbi:hypothetical protein LOY37_16125 [Pseudomonas sp. B21-012]|uniref:hypothetical protein n=1 Tax=Pseudomonas sp. B21-012 TaxID=2895472 RepID=UPI00215E0A9D|nr:hypothetical protein [Pseudomonas sp. B21-012]UVM53893.1 hypothetical protein LOY37_16125 [Pseudomonas sp. B21-012]
MIEDSVPGDPEGLVILDCITAESADALRGLKWANIQPGNEHLENTLLLTIRQRDLLNLPIWGDFFLLRPAPAWICFNLNDSGAPAEGVEATFVGLAGEREEAPLRLTLSDMRWASPQLQSLALLTGLSVRKQRILDVLEQAAAKAGPSRWTVAYDVGQGNANALVDEGGHPRLFYDLGWPTSFNARTRPANRPALLAGDRCCSHDSLPAPVVLSHWDFDHWAFAVANTSYNFGKKAAHITFDPLALQRYWIVPRPPTRYRGVGLGPTHLRFISQLGQRLVWPNRLRRVAFSAGVITRTDPVTDPYDRNNQGLAWFVMENQSAQTAILLPGDIEYAKLHWPASAPDLLSLVASHHGGRAGAPPMAAIPAASHLTLSLGAGNVHRHPSAAALRNHSLCGWPTPLSTSNRSTPPGSLLATGSVLIPLNPLALRPTFSCPTLIASNLVPTQ